MVAGDGTVMWVVEEAHNHKINTENMHIGMLPLGTGTACFKSSLLFQAIAGHLGSSYTYHCRKDNGKQEEQQCKQYL